MFAGAGAALAALLLILARGFPDRAVGIPSVRLPAARADTPSLCPWREPKSDLQAFYPAATGYHSETRIVSAQRLALTRELGRPPAADETAVHLFRVEGGSGPLGTVMVRRVKGRYGAIEVVTALDPTGRVHGVRLQSLREPEAQARELRNPSWLSRFRGKAADSDWSAASGSPDVSAEARPSAAAIAEGVRAQAAIYAIAERSGLKAPEEHHHGT